MSITQNKRSLRIEKSPLGADELLLTGFRGREGLSELFCFHLDLLSETWNISPHSIVGKPITVSVPLSEGKRYFNGMVRRFSRGPAAGNSGLRQYRAELVPWLWFLTRSSNCRIFSEQSVKDILEKVFTEHHFNHETKFELSGTHPKREYCVQYRETDLAFVSRLMESEGMFYYFRHESGKHELVVADASSAYKDCPEKRIDYFPGDRTADHISHWDHNYEFRSGKWSQSDYNFETPTNKLATESKTLHGFGDAEAYTLYEYPGNYGKTPEGDSSARIRMEEEEVCSDTTTAQSGCRTLHPAGRFQLQSKDRASEDHDHPFAITSVDHSASDDSYTQEGGGGLVYNNSFTCIPADVVFRPPRLTPRPSVQGLESAVVVGPDKDTVHTDKYGRIKVKFHWDRAEKSESCWIRTSQAWAGNSWGSVFLPRVGQEVVISFLGGDPDRPIITGSVYNAQQMPPYKLPDDASQSGIKSRSWPDGASDAFNELRFDDKKDKEAVYFQAQKDFSRYVKHDDSLKVDNDRTVEVKKNVTTTLDEGNETRTLKEGNRATTLNKGNDSLTLDKGNRSATITEGNDTLTLGKGNRSATLTKGNDELTLNGGNQTVTLDTGNHSLKLDAGKSTTEAMQSIELKVGANSIKIDQGGITIKGVQVKIQGDTMVEVQGGTMVQIKSDLEVQVKGVMGQISGSGMLMLKGAVVMIN